MLERAGHVVEDEADLDVERRRIGRAALEPAREVRVGQLLGGEGERGRSRLELAEARVGRDEAAP
jgi:hypothetical protein